MTDLGYKRFIFTAAQQATLQDLLAQQHKAVVMGTGPTDSVLARKYKGLLTSIRRQSERQSDYLSKLAKDSAPPRASDVGFVHTVRG